MGLIRLMGSSNLLLLITVEETSGLQTLSLNKLHRNIGNMGRDSLRRVP